MFTQYSFKGRCYFWFPLHPLLSTIQSVMECSTSAVTFILPKLVHYLCSWIHLIAQNRQNKNDNKEQKNTEKNTENHKAASQAAQPSVNLHTLSITAQQYTASKFKYFLSICMRKKTKLSYCKQIACQLRTQYVEGIYKPKYYTVTFY